MHAQPSESYPRPRCHGRQAEIEHIRSRLDRAQQDGASFVLVTGRPAIGKSTLIAEALHQLRPHGVLTLEGRCAVGLRSYRPVLEIARRAWEHLCAEGVSDDLLEPIEQLFDLLHLRVSQEQEGLAPVARRLQLFDRMATLLRAAGQRYPTVVVLHDIDRADRPTLELLAYLGRTLTARPELTGERSTGQHFHGLLLATATRVPAELTELDQAGGLNLSHLDLDGLDTDGIRGYLGSEEVVRRVLELTGGDPGLLEAITSQSPARNPSEQTSPSETRLLELLAVFGRPLGAETLRLLTGLPLSELSKCIAALTRRRVLEKLVVDGELQVGFAQASDQSAAYDSMGARRQRALHGEVGSHLQRQGDAELEACATHLLLGGRKGQAVEVTLEAGRRLELSLCFERAADLYERALPLADQDASGTDSARALELSERLCTVCQVTGQLDRALQHAERCREARPDDREAALRVINLQLLRRDLAAARAELGQIQADQPDPALLALSARVHYLAGERDQARVTARQGIALLHPACRCRIPQHPVRDARTGTPPRRGARNAIELLQPEDLLSRLSLQNTLGKLLLEDGETEGARALFSDNLERSRSASMAEEATLAMIQLGLIELEQDRFEQAELHYRQALEQAADAGEHRLRGACLQHLGVIAERRCAYGQALELYQEAVNVWKQAWLRSYLAWVAVDLGQLYLKLGQVERARAMAELSERMADADPPLRTRINRALLRGRIAARECHYAEAEVWLRQAEELATTGDEHERRLESQLELCELRLEQGLPGQALEDLAQAGSQAGGEHERGGRTSFGTRHLHLRSLLIQGRACMALDQTARARAALAEALELSDQLPDPEAIWQSRYLLALVSRAEGREADARRLLSRAADAEARVRQQIPAALRERAAELPLRRGLAQALRQHGEPIIPARPACESIRTTAFASIVGRHPRMQQVFAHLEKVAATDALVLIRGESGTGKELVAEAIHRRSRRAGKPLVKVNCGALVESLLLSELFGHERGAFTGATERRKGRFEAADGGTIFLDEIGDISPATQVALLRVLQQQEFERVGGTTPIQVNVRIICATNRDLEQMVADGSFREDLYYRLRGFVIDVPALRDRIDDLPLLVDHFLAVIARERNTPPRLLSEAALRLLRRHGWNGNVRELENVLRSVSLLSDSEVLDVADFADYPELGQGRAEPATSPAAPPTPYEQIRDSGVGLREFKKQIEYQCIVEALEEAQGSITAAAGLLGVKRPRLSQMIKEHNITLKQRLRSMP